MKTMLRIVTVFAALQATSVFAASGAGGGGIGLIGWIFIGFMAVIVAFQFVPAVIMFGSMMAAVFGKAKNRESAAHSAKADNS
ncbi:MAG: hypothetical protein JXR80_09740 [Deltaproteobacteria bacterium]|nr:hypothetical protein [Deltaproteobacteria bacterium]